MTGPSAIPPNASAVPAADLVAPAANTGPIVHQSFPVRQPEEDANEVIVGIRGRALRRVRVKLKVLTVLKRPWADLLLAFSTLCLGGFMGALSSNLPWAVLNAGTPEPSWRAIVFYALLPVLGTASLVAFFCLRHFAGRNASEIADDVLEELPDPDRIL